jgi:hypothetical protein
MIKSPARLWPALAGVLWSAWCGGLSSPAWSGDPAGAPGGVNYLLHVKPLLRSRCVACHGAIEQEGGLRLDAAKLILAGGDDGAVVVPGQGAGSRLIQRVSAADPAERMPPKGAPLATHEIELLKAWIDAGAPSPEEEPITQNPREHWAFQPVRLPPIPAVQDRAWAKNAIDQFVLAKLEARNWRPNPAASRPALLRRIYLDLLGLPPTPAEQEAWLESAAPDADEQLVAALLQNDAYGERYARHWLDVVRYADSNGYERDAAKPAVWRYRDYVIRALNQDLPFNRFLLEQMAGDELADADASTMIATGFHRLGPWDDEPADPAADRFDQLDDLVSTASQAFLGLTLRTHRIDVAHGDVGTAAVDERRGQTGGPARIFSAGIARTAGGDAYSGSGQPAPIGRGGRALRAGGPLPRSAGAAAAGRLHVAATTLVRPMADGQGASPDGPGDREPGLAVAFRLGTGPHLQ